MFVKGVVLFGIISEKVFQAIIICNIFTLLCRKSFHFSFLLFNLIAFLILKGSPDSYWNNDVAFLLKHPVEVGCVHTVDAKQNLLTHKQ